MVKSKLGWNKRKIGKDVFTFHTWEHNKSDAQEVADKHRKTGYKARVIITKRKTDSGRKKPYYNVYLKVKHPQTREDT
jgi:hypothetical protein